MAGPVEKIEEEVMSFSPVKATPSAAAELMDDVTEVVRLRVQLAKQEAREMAVTNLVAGAVFATGAVLAGIAILARVPVLLVVILPTGRCCNLDRRLPAAGSRGA
jgi:Putative Actinobacterial Holin-X, holin superfamily III